MIGGINKMKIGDYVRTKNGMIAKIIDKKDLGGSLHDTNEVFVLSNKIVLSVYSKKVKKYSSNRIVLIEVGDYVNGMKITNIWVDKETGNIEFEFNNNEWYLYVKNWNYESRVTKYKIKSIVTKEQFESMEYKVVE